MILTRTGLHIILFAHIAWSAVFHIVLFCVVIVCCQAWMLLSYAHQTVPGSVVVSHATTMHHSNQLRIIDSSEFFTFISFHVLGKLNTYILVDFQFERVVLFVIEYLWISKPLQVLAPLVCNNLNLPTIFGGCVFRTLLPRYMKVLRILLSMVSKRFRYKNKTSVESANEYILEISTGTIGVAKTFETTKLLLRHPNRYINSFKASHID